MSTRFTRPAAAYDSTSVTTNKDKYQNDDASEVAIDAPKVDGDINNLIDAVNALDDDVGAVVAGALPSQSGNSGKMITTNGTTASWVFVDTANIAADAITADEIQDGSVNAAELNTNAVTTVKIADANVTTAKIADDAVTLAKLDAGTAGNLITYDASGDPAAVLTGSTNQVLTSNGAGAAPTFQDLNPGLTLLATASASASASVEFTSGIDSTYDHYIIEIANLTTSNNGALELHYSTDGGSTYLSSGYGYANHHMFASTGAAVANSASFPYIPLTNNLSTTSGLASSGIVHLFEPSNTSSETYTIIDFINWSGSSGNLLINHVGGTNSTTSAVTAVRFVKTSGTITTGGFKLYGVRKS